MKINILIIMALFLSVGTVDVSAQNFLNKLKKTVKKKVENRVEKEVKKQVNKGFDTVTGKDNDPAQTKKKRTQSSANSPRPKASDASSQQSREESRDRISAMLGSLACLLLMV